MEKEKLSFKDKMDILEAFCTIVVSVMAIWGTIVAWENGFWHKIKHIADHMHEQFLQDERDNRNDNAAAVSRFIKDVEKEMKK